MNRILLFLCILFTAILPSAYADHLSSHLMFTARMNGNQEVPAVSTDGIGVGIFTLDERKTTLYINVSLSSLSGPITGMHIHQGNAGENGGVVFDLVPFLNGNRAKGVIRDITPDVITRLLNGGYYINVHTELNPGGEIRGQIELETDNRYTALMAGANEVPSVVTDGVGLGIFHLNHERTSVHFKVLFRGLTSDITGAHIHIAPEGLNGPVIFNLAPFMVGNNYIEGDWDPGTDLDALLNGGLYINVHTMNNPGGEIRGQILLLPGITFDAELDGDFENPPVDGPGKGLGIVTIKPELDAFQYYVVYDSLSGPAISSHFHRGVFGANGGVVVDISDDISTSDDVISGSQPLSLDIFNTLLNGGFYINVHTDANPGGEIRGQVYKFAREGYTLDLNGGQEAPSVTTTGVGAGFVSIDRDQTNAHYTLVVSGLMGNFTASHFHRAFPGVSGGVIHNISSSFNVFGGAEGYWDASNTPPFSDAASLFRSGEIYVNVHTDMFPGGEIRGNVIRSSSLYTSLPFDPKFGDNVMLAAQLSGLNENPPVTTDAVGLATIYFDSDRTKATVNVAVTGLSGPITGAHIHDGITGSNGPVIFPLANEGNRIQVEITGITPEQLSKFVNGEYYINVHTTANPGGEIRGQIFIEQDLTFVAGMGGQNENPPVDTAGFGLGLFHYTLWNLSLDVNVQFTALTSDVTGAHLHKAVPGMNGPVVIDLGSLIDGNAIRGEVPLTIDDLNALFAGELYINVHTTNNPGGEIRGQLNYISGINFDGWMSGIQEVPFTTTAASGLAIANVTGDLSTVNVYMVTHGASGPIGASHLHKGFMNSNGGVVVDLSAALFENSLVFSGPVPDGLMKSLLEGEIYINAHTAAYPGGELRGQLFRLARDGYGFDLCAEQETSTVVAPGSSGNGLVSMDRLHSNINLSVVTDGLTGDITAAHIHQAPIGVSGGVLVPLTDFFSNGAMFISGGGVDTTITNGITRGDLYVNVHTATHPGGEIRGQIVKESLCKLETGIDPLADIISDVQLSPVPVMDFLNVQVEAQTSSTLSFNILDVSGKVLSTDTYAISLGENNVTLQTETLVPGFYVLMITDGDVAQAYKFVK